MMNRRYCGYVTTKDLKQKIIIQGWIKKIRKLGSLIFLDVADRYGLVQVIVEESNENFKIVETLTRESVVQVFGEVIARKSPNNTIPTGEIEIKLISLIIFSKAQTPPILIENNDDSLEDTKLKYRYLDLRRPIVQNNLIFRSKFINTMRQFLINNDFIEVETPILAKPTPEGARDFLVATRNAGKFYALPQSPQIYKQLLMISGLLKYFQIARCFRDEDLRSDRQPEFTQLDIEMSFVEIPDIMFIIEALFKYCFQQVLNLQIKTPFIQMTYDEAVNNYGCDKPDLRFGFKLIDASVAFKDSSFNVFKNIVTTGGSIKGIFVNDQLLAKKQMIELQKYACDNKAKDLAWITIENNKVIDGSIKKFIDFRTIQKILKSDSNQTGTLLLVAGELKIVNAALGAVRNTLGDMLNLKDPQLYQFVWIIDWPLYEYDVDNQKYTPAHHPFTSPSDECLSTFDTNPATARAKAYDLVLNGSEIGGGSIRIIDPQVQTRMFKTIGINIDEANSKFGYLLEGFKYGVPPHGGIAFGLDRLIMILTNAKTIRDVIAFPKNSQGIDLMMDTPSKVAIKDLQEVGLTLLKK